MLKGQHSCQNLPCSALALATNIKYNHRVTHLLLLCCCHHSPPSLLPCTLALGPCRLDRLQSGQRCINQAMRVHCTRRRGQGGGGDPTPCVCSRIALHASGWMQHAQQGSLPPHSLSSFSLSHMKCMSRVFATEGRQPQIDTTDSMASACRGGASRYAGVRFGPGLGQAAATGAAHRASWTI